MKQPLLDSEKLFHKYKDKVFGFFVDFLNNRELSRDLTQDIFVKILQKEETLQSVEDMDGYIYQMCRNLAFDHLKKAAHSEQYRAYLMHGQSTFEPSTNQTERKIEADHYRYILQQSLEKLPDQQRIIFNLSKKEGLSHKKIAQKLGISSHTVRNHLFQAMKNIRADISNSDTELLIMLLIFWCIT